MADRQNSKIPTNIGVQARPSDVDARRDSGAEIHRPGFRTNSEEARLLQLAGNLLARSDALESSISAIEGGSQACKCAQIVSDSIVELLEKAKVLLYNMRDIPDPKGRVLLARSFNEFLNHVDLLVADGHFDGRNLTKNENIVISVNGGSEKGLSIPGSDMSCAGLELAAFVGESISNSDIVDRLTKAESAIGTLVAHSFTYDAIAFLLQSRMKFARGMIDVLEEGSEQINDSRAGHDAVSQVLSEIYGTMGAKQGAEIGTPLPQPTNHRASTPPYTKSVARPPM